jgi:hypothetical protein
MSHTQGERWGLEKGCTKLLCEMVELVSSHPIKTSDGAP